MTIAEATQQAVPIRKVFIALGIGPVTGHALINSGELETFLIGSRRFVTSQAMAKFIRKRVLATREETREQRAARVAPAVEARQRKRAERAAA